MCCGFHKTAGIVAGMMHMMEKMISCFAVASVITCFVLTTLCMIALGIGIGYNYCIGELKAGEKFLYKWQHASAVRMFPPKPYYDIPRTGNNTDMPTPGDAKMTSPEINYKLSETPDSSASSGASSGASPGASSSSEEPIIQKSRSDIDTNSLKKYLKDMMDSYDPTGEPLGQAAAKIFPDVNLKRQGEDTFIPTEFVPLEYKSKMATERIV